MITNQKELRRVFWQEHPRMAEQARAAGMLGKRQNDQCATFRCAFVDWLDGLARAGVVSEKLAQRATL